MNEPDHTPHLANTAVTALAVGGQTALDDVIRDLDDNELELLITHMARTVGLHVRFGSVEDGTADRRPR